MSAVAGENSNAVLSAVARKDADAVIPPEKNAVAGEDAVAEILPFMSAVADEDAGIYSFLR